MTSPNKEEMANELAMLTDATRRLCKLHGTLGLEYPNTAGFANIPATPTASQPPVSKGQPKVRSSRPPAGHQEPPAFCAEDVATLNDTISHCERCLAEDKRPTPLFGKGKQDRPALLIIGDAAASRGDVERGRIFQDEAEKLLIKMLAAINLNEGDVFQANIIRCAIDTNEVPQETQLQNCLPHLIKQITLLRPQIICTMGQLASQALLENKNQLIALRGRFHQFKNIPLMATYHPNQLLQVPDLKKAAWYDLQLIQYKLGKLKER
ncbi:MAG: uracil-DNA glycosylase [Thermodesulfobacteriota bacterium]